MTKRPTQADMALEPAESVMRVSGGTAETETEAPSTAVVETREAPEVISTDPILMLAANLARIPGINEAIFDRIMAAQAAEKAAQAEERFNDAMSACQAEIAPVARTAENKQIGSFYAKLEAVDASIRPIYIRHGFAVSYNTVPPLAPGNIRVECEVSLGRHSKRYYREAPADTLGPKGTAVKTILHGGGSTETFLKRYAVTGAFNVVFKALGDDDGNKGGAQYIDEEQIAILGSLVAETKTNVQDFLRLMVSDEIYEINEVQQKDFARLANALQRKQKQMAAKKDKANAEGP